MLAAVAAAGQPTRRDILEKKIKSVTSVYYNETGGREYSQKTLFSVKGYDSLEYFNDEALFKFIPEIYSDGRLKQLARVDMKNNDTEEWHLYTYKEDGFYTVEIIAQGAGTVLVSDYSPAGDCLSEIFSGVDTVIYSYNGLGKIAGVKKEQSGKLRDLSKTEFDVNGYPVTTHVFGELPIIIRYKNNSLGLPEELKQYTKAASADKPESVITFSYEFY